MYLTENLQDKWQPVLEHPDLPKIEDAYKRAVTTVILENQEKAVRASKNATIIRYWLNTHETRIIR